MALIIVDGYNVIYKIARYHDALESGLESARDALLFDLERFAHTFAHSITVVFDGGGRPRDIESEDMSRERFAGLDVIFSKRMQSADRAIIELLGQLKGRHGFEFEDKAPCDVVVVSGDFGITDEAAEFGAHTTSPEALFDAMQDDRDLRF